MTNKKSSKSKKSFRSKIAKDIRKKRIIRYIYESIFISLCITTFLFSLISLDIVFINFYTIIPTNALLAMFLVLIFTFILFTIIIFIIDYSFSELWIKKHRLSLK